MKYMKYVVYVGFMEYMGWYTNLASNLQQPVYEEGGGIDCNRSAARKWYIFAGSTYFYF